MSLWHPARAYPSLDYKGVGLYRTFTAGASITAGQVVSLHTDGKVYPSSSTYPNVVGVALDTASSGGLVRVLVSGIVDVVADGAINPGDPVTFSTVTAGRVVKYAGHTHGLSKSTGTFLTGVTTGTGTFVTGITKSTGTVLTGIGSDTGWTTDAAGYARHTHSTSTGTFLSDVTPSTGTAVTSVSTSTGTALTDASVTSTLSRVIGIALTGSTAAGQTITILVIPAWL
ncbi:MAG: hypothetical protein LM568_02955 [Desulfurococcaceae archaeon]|nr:hypothetical protein [Desulfurococcaceae archaeon]